MIPTVVIFKDRMVSGCDGKRASGTVAKSSFWTFAMDEVALATESSDRGRYRLLEFAT